jgi:tetratricopeptide (TPR) repeat protein
VKPTANIEAYDFYLLGRRSMESRESEDLYESAEYFKRAIDLDPRFALAYTGLAYVSGLRTFYDENAESPALLAEAGVAAGRALELDPELGDAHVAYGLVRLFLGDPPETYGPHFEKGVALAPGSADARKWYGAYLSDTNRPEEALEQLQRAVQLDPMSPILRVNLGETLWWELGRRDEALAQFERALEIDPRFFSANYAIDGTMTAAEKLEYRSRTYVKSAEYPWTIADFVQNYLALGDPTRAEQWLAEFERVHPDSGWALLLHLYLSLYLSHQTESLDWAVRALETEVSRFAVPSRTLLWHDLRRGDPGTALARYGQKYPAMLEDDPEVASFAMLLRVMGQVQKSDTLLDRSLAFMAPLPESQLWEFGIHKARVHAIRGETEAALNTLREVIDAGWYREWWLFLKQDPVFDILRDDARFQLIVDELAADMARQLAMVRQGEMSGDIRLPK